MYDGAYCSERFGSNYMAGSTADEMYEFYGDPNNGDYDEEFVVAVERDLRDQSLIEENRRLRQEIAYLRDELDEDEDCGPLSHWDE